MGKRRTVYLAFPFALLLLGAMLVFVAIERRSKGEALPSPEPLHLQDAYSVDPVETVKEVLRVRDEAIEQDPANEASYHLATEGQLRDLYALHEAYERGLVSCETRVVPTTDQGFSRLLLRYDLTMYPTHTEIDEAALVGPQQDYSSRRYPNLDILRQTLVCE